MTDKRGPSPPPDDVDFRIGSPVTEFIDSQAKYYANIESVLSRKSNRQWETKKGTARTPTSSSWNSNRPRSRMRADRNGTIAMRRNRSSNPSRPGRRNNRAIRRLTPPGKRRAGQTQPRRNQKGTKASMAQSTQWPPMPPNGIQSSTSSDEDSSFTEDGYHSEDSRPSPKKNSRGVERRKSHQMWNESSGNWKHSISSCRSAGRDASEMAFSLELSDSELNGHDSIDDRHAINCDDSQGVGVTLDDDFVHVDMCEQDENIVCDSSEIDVADIDSSNYPVRLSEEEEEAREDVYNWMLSWSTTSDGDQHGDVVLDLSRKGISQFPLLDAIVDLVGKGTTQLLVLNLGKNNFSVLPSDIGKISTLSELHLFSNSLRNESFPSGALSSLSNLTRLVLSGNRLTKVPLALSSLPAIRQVDLHSNDIEVLDDEAIGVLTCIGSTLATFNLGFNSINELPKEVCMALPNLERFYLQGNDLRVLPEAICNMKSLSVLRVSGNPLQQPPIATAEKGPSVIKRYFEALQVDGRLRVNPPTAPLLRPLSASKMIDTTFALDSITRNGSNQVGVKANYGNESIQFGVNTSYGMELEPSSVLSPATQDTISSHETQVLIEQQRIDRLTISSSDPSANDSTHQTTIDTSFEKARTTVNQIDKSLEPRGPKISTIDAAPHIPPARTLFGASTAAAAFRQVPTRAVPPPKVLFQVQPPKATSPVTVKDVPVPTQSNKSVVEHFNQHDALKQQFKLVILGKAMSGKTSMIRSLLGGKSILMDKVDGRTLGIDIYSCELSAEKIWHCDQLQDQSDSKSDTRKVPSKKTKNNNTSKFAIWDFAGQRVYHSTHQCFLSSRALYVIVWDINCYSPIQLDDAVFFWIYSVQARVPGVVIQIVATKCEGLSDNEIERRKELLRERFATHEDWRLDDIEDNILECEDLMNLEQANNIATGHPDDLFRRVGDISPLDEQESPKLTKLRLLQKMRPQVQHDIISVSSQTLQGMERLTQCISSLSTNDVLFPHIGPDVYVPRSWSTVLRAVEKLRLKAPFATWTQVMSMTNQLQRTQDIGVGHRVLTPETVAACLEWLNDVGDIVHNQHHPGGTDLDLLPELSEVKTSTNGRLQSTFSTLSGVGSTGHSTRNLVFLDPAWLVDVVKRLVSHNKLRSQLLPQTLHEKHSVTSSSQGTMIPRRSSANRRSNPKRGTGNTTQRTRTKRLNPSEIDFANKSLAKGILREALFPILWPELERITPSSENHVGENGASYKLTLDSLMQVLTEFDICYEISNSHPKDDDKTNQEGNMTNTRSWFVPCLVNETFDYDNAWPYLEPEPEYLQRGESIATRMYVKATEAPFVAPLELCRRFVFHRFVPPSIISKLLRSFVNTSFLGALSPEVYTNAVKYTFNAGSSPHHQHFELLCTLRTLSNPGYDNVTERNVLEVAVRGDVRGVERMWKALMICVNRVQSVLSSYTGLSAFQVIPCPRCLQVLGPDRDDATEYSLIQIQHEAASFDWKRSRFTAADGPRRTASHSRITLRQASAPATFGYETQPREPSAGDMSKGLSRLISHATSSSSLISNESSYEVRNDEDAHLMEYLLQVQSSTMACDRRHHCPITWLSPTPEAIKAASEVHAGHADEQSGNDDDDDTRKDYLLKNPAGLGYLDCRCIVRLAVYHRNTGAFLQCSTGFVVDRRSGTIVTAGHLIQDPLSWPKTVRYYRRDNDVLEVFDKEDCVIVVGMYVGQDRIPEWKYFARVAKHAWSEDVHGNVYDKVPENADVSQFRFVDAVILQIDGEVNVSLVNQTAKGNEEPSYLHSLKSFVKITPVLAARIPFLPAELVIGDSSLVNLNDPVTLPSFPGYFCETLCVSNSHINIKENGVFRTCAFQHMGSSGGPLIHHDGTVIGLMSKARSCLIGSATEIGEHVAINSVKQEVDRVIQKHLELSRG